MTTKTTTQPQAKIKKIDAVAQNGNPATVNAKAETSADQKEEVVKKASEKINAILTPSAKSRLNKLETLNILADKYNSVSKKYDELTHFIAGNDTTNATMKFSSESNYSFTLRNPTTINKILVMVEREFSEIVEKAEQDVLLFEV